MRRHLVLLCASLMAAPTPAAAEVVRLVVDHREDVLGGMAFGAGGGYVKLTGRVFFEFDPGNRFNGRIVDLPFAPVNERGRVEAWANFVILMPKDASRGNGTAFLEVSNRGGKASLSYFNAAQGSRNPSTAEHFGDGFLMRNGFTVVWVGWQHDVALVDDMMRSYLPVATDAGGPIEGWVRSDWTVDEPATVLSLGHRANLGYPVEDPAHPGNTLTVRDGREGERRVVPRNQWRFVSGNDGRELPRLTHIELEGGFRAGKIYEAVYRAADPTVVGLGPAIVRDMMSFLKYDERSPTTVQRGIGIGISQTGRFLRHFVYQGFNTDESNRQVFDGLMIHTAGAGRGSFNHRFAQPSRDAHRYSAFFYPTDLFPFSGRTQTDPVAGLTDGLFAHQFDDTHLPRIFYTNSGYEYWGRAASLLHLSVDGARDVPPLPNERIYHIASAQHFVRGFPPRGGPRLDAAGAYRTNPLDFMVNLRALLTRMDDWVWDRRTPPDSRYPTLAANNLVEIGDVQFPRLTALAFPTTIHLAYRADYGPRWRQGIVDLQPPRLGPPFPVRVAQVDEVGNEIGGVRNVEIRVPLATYAPWNLRWDYPGATHELTNFVGTHIPFPRTETERRARNDPRPSVESLYQNRRDYAGRVERAARDLVTEGFLLSEDVDRVVNRALAHWDWFWSER